MFIDYNLCKWDYYKFKERIYWAKSNFSLLLNCKCGIFESFFYMYTYLVDFEYSKNERIYWILSIKMVHLDVTWYKLN